MDDEHALRRIDRELGAMAAKLEHMPTQHDMRAVRKEFSDADFQTLREVSTQLGHFRSDVKEWISSSREDTAQKLLHLETRLMAAARDDRSWIIKNLPVLLALAGIILAIVSGNPHWLSLT